MLFEVLFVFCLDDRCMCIYFSVVFNYVEFELGTLFSVVFIATIQLNWEQILEYLK